VATYISNISTEYVKNGHRVWILSPGKFPKHHKYHGLQICKESSQGKPSIFKRLILKLAKFLPITGPCILWALDVKNFVEKNGPFDVIEAPEWGASMAFISLNKDAKCVVHLHRSTRQYLLDNKLPISLDQYIRIFMEYLCVLNSQAVVCPTKYLINQNRVLITVCRFLHKKISVIPHGIPLPTLSHNKERKEKYILFVGRLERAKGPELLIQAFSKMVNSFPRLKLYLIGEDTDMQINGNMQSYRSYLEKMTTKLQISDKVHFAGKLPHGKLSNYYLNSMVYVTPSIGTENMSIALLEAISYGNPVIVSSAGGSSEVLSKSKNGLIFQENNANDLFEKLYWMTSDSTIRRKFRHSAILNRSYFDVKKNARIRLIFYKRLMRKDHSLS
jgi:glycosyltransferase involved in cell wall biosynthesis